MFYVKLASDGSIEQYPYTLTDLVTAHRNVSFPTVITPDIIADFGLASVTPTDQPTVDHTQNLTRGAEKLPDGSYAETWTAAAASTEEIAERTANKADSVRFTRDEALKNSDWTQLPDSPLSAEKKQEWATYRQQLRDLLSDTSANPKLIEIPDEPTA
jgi:hypothetical protein